MADELIETLAKLKPARPNRDAILFAAGQAAGRGSSVWKWLSIVLMVSHAVLLGIWLTPPNLAEKIPVPEQQPDSVEPKRPNSESPEFEFSRSTSLLNLEVKISEPIPTMSVVPEEHWTVRSPIRFD